MSEERLRRVEELFHEAVAIANLEQRADYLAAICEGNPDLRHAVEALLVSDEIVKERAGPELPRFGAYQAKRVIGRGGMGVVWEAERSDGEFDRKVAVKLLSDWTVSAAAREHFRRERQILAHLEHPGIARLLDGGVTEDGAPYLVMEYIDGDHIDIHCERHGLNSQERQRLFFEVLEALEYAHAQRVVHRDVKPSNIMVDRKGRVRLLDFGTARLLERPGDMTADKTVLRGVTPGFSSPEMMSGETVDERTDVYSLGVLYEKLLGAAADARVAAKARAPKRVDRYASVAALRKAVATAGRARWQRWALVAGAILLVGVAAVWLRPRRAASMAMAQVSAAGESWQDVSAAANDWLAFSSDRAVPGEHDIWISRQDGSQVEAVTRDAVRDHEPAISPDGRWVVFTSERNPQGLYEFDRQTKKTRWLATGRLSAFSPDGKWLLVARVDDRTDPGWAGKGVWQIMPARGGQMRVVGGDLAEIVAAVWSPDSTAVYLQSAVRGAARIGTVWRQQISGGEPAQWAELPHDFALCGFSRLGVAYLKHKVKGELAISTWPAMARPVGALAVQPLGGALSRNVNRCAMAGDTLFAQVVPELARRFELAMDWHVGRARGVPREMAAPGGWQHHSSASADGQVRTYVVEDALQPLIVEANGRSLWSPQLAGQGLVSKGGAVLWFGGELGNSGPTAWVQRDRPETLRFHSNAGLLWDTAFDGSFALAYRGGSRPAEISWLSKDGGSQTVLAHPTWNLYRAALSWDQRWVAFTAVKEDGKVWMYAAPFHGQQPIPFQEWVQLGRGGSQIWSPDGNRILFLSRRDGHSCLYQQPLDPASKRPLGEPEVVAHFHGRDTVSNLQQDTFRMSATNNGLIFSLGRREDRIVRLR